MRIVRTFSVDKLERIQSLGKTSETKSIHCFEDYASMSFASKTQYVVSPYISRMDNGRVYFSREFFDLRLRYESTSYNSK